MFVSYGCTFGKFFAFAWLASAGVQADEAVPRAACFDDEVLRHVRTQFAHYGPRSVHNEFFGFIYRKDGRIAGAVTFGFDCRGQFDCYVNPAFASARIPKGAKVLGEWHTHPHVGTAGLSLEDVRGAHANRHVRCYSAFYSSPDGEIYRWDIAATLVSDAMASRTQVGSYRARDPQADSKFANNCEKGSSADAEADDAAIIAAPDSPGTTCLSTNTNALTAASTQKCCRRSPTSR